MKERLTLRGLTTAASIWMTVAIGIVNGLGFYFVAGAAVLIALVTLSLFPWVEKVLPSAHYAVLSVRYASTDPIPEEKVGEILEADKVPGVNTSYQLEDGEQHFRYQMTIRSRSVDAFWHLANTLQQINEVREFSITPMSN